MPAVLHYAGARLELHEDLDAEGARNLIAGGWRQSKSVNVDASAADRDAARWVTLPLHGGGSISVWVGDPLQELLVQEVDRHHPQAHRRLG